jgi:hypothetical protein
MEPHLRFACPPPTIVRRPLEVTGRSQKEATGSRPDDGKEIEASAKEVLAANKDVIERMEKLLGK